MESFGRGWIQYMRFGNPVVWVLENTRFFNACFKSTYTANLCSFGGPSQHFIYVYLLSITFKVLESPGDSREIYWDMCFKTLGIKTKLCESHEIQ